jgi:serine protease AprX
LLRTVLLNAPPLSPVQGEGWHRYRARVAPRLAVIRRRAAGAAGLTLTPLFAANALYGVADEEKVGALREAELGPGVTLLERGAGPCPGPGEEVGEPAPSAFPPRSPVPLPSSPVAVAVLDSGIDLRHPYLTVAASASACPEPVSLPGRHATHCAGVIASRYPDHPGLVPEVRLLNLKVARADGRTTPAFIARGIDLALDLGADVLSISIGLNHFPLGPWGGHAWDCPDGRCLLCRAVDHAVVAAGAVVVAAAGNEYLRTSRMRALGQEPTRDTDLLCPGQARGAITVGAIGDEPGAAPYPFSSRGPTSYGLSKPDLWAPGVDVTSTIPCPDRETGGIRSPSDLFGKASGTSVASALIAGAAARVIARRRARGDECSPDEILSELRAEWPSAGAPAAAYAAGGP